MGRAGGEPSNREQKGPGNPTKPPERIPVGRPGLSPSPCPRGPRGRGPSRSAERQPPREAGGCAAGPGQLGAAGAREEWEAPAKVWAAPSRPRPGLRGAPPARAYSSRAARPSPGVPGGARPAAKPRHPGRRPPPELLAPRKRKRRRRRRPSLQPAGARSAGGGGARGGVAAGRCARPSRRPRAPRLASRAQPLPGSATDTHPPSTHRPPPPPATAAAAPRATRASGNSPAGAARLPGSFRAASSASLDFSFSIPALSCLGGGGGGRGMGAREGKGVKIDEDYCSF